MLLTSRDGIAHNPKVAGSSSKSFRSTHPPGALHGIDVTRCDLVVQEQPTLPCRLCRVGRKPYRVRMSPTTEALWAKQNQHEGDRLRLFAAVADHAAVSRVLYPGSFVDVAASFVFPTVTYLDMDRRAAKFFGDAEGVDEIIAANQTSGGTRAVEFIAADYREALGLADESFDLLVSLYAGFVSEYCTQYLRIGGFLLVNPSHGDAAMASIDDRYRLAAVITSGGMRSYRVDDRDLDTYLVPKKPQPVTVDRLHDLGRGIGYTRSPFAYLFERIA